MSFNYLCQRYCFDIIITNIDICFLKLSKDVKVTWQSGCNMGQSSLKFVCTIILSPNVTLSQFLTYTHFFPSSVT